MITNSRLEKIKTVISKRKFDITVVLEDIHDPHNAGAILRTCDAYGIQNVYFIFDKQTPYNPKKISKSSSGSANKWLNFLIYNSINKCISDLKKKNFQIVSTSLTEGAVNLYDFNFKKSNIALILGNEHSGLSDPALKLSDAIIKIPILGMVQSLNVSVTAGIIISEISRQRINLKSKLSKSQKDELMNSFLRV